VDGLDDQQQFFGAIDLAFPAEIRLDSRHDVDACGQTFFNQGPSDMFGVALFFDGNQSFRVPCGNMILSGFVDLPESIVHVLNARYDDANTAGIIEKIRPLKS